MTTGKRLQGKNIVITGGTHGIGRAITEAFAREGANILFSYRQAKIISEELISVIRPWGVDCHSMQLDAQELGAVDALMNKAEEVFDTIHVLVNNVGITTRSAYLNITSEEFSAVMTTNFQFPFFLTQRCAQLMKAKGTAGSVINISSISAFKAISKLSHYQCSKAALSMLTKSAAIELAPFNIRVNTLSPGLTACEGNRNQWEGDPALWKERGKDIPLGRAGNATDHAGAAVFLASDESSWMTGAEIIVDGGESAI